MSIEGGGVTADDDIFSLCCFDNVDDIGHADDSCVFVEYGVILYFEVLAFSESLVDRISLEHEGHFDSHFEANDIIILLA